MFTCKVHRRHLERILDESAEEVDWFCSLNWRHSAYTISHHSRQRYCHFLKQRGKKWRKKKPYLASFSSSCRTMRWESLLDLSNHPCTQSRPSFPLFPMKCDLWTQHDTSNFRYFYQLEDFQTCWLPTATHHITDVSLRDNQLVALWLS